MSKIDLKIRAKLLCVEAVIFACLAAALAQSQARPEEESLRVFLQTKADDRKTHYVAVLSDLNGDGRPEALAYLIGNDWCGSGGCNLFVLQKHGNSWAIVSSVTITYPPVQLLSSVSNGWRDLKVDVGGGGARPGVVMLRFNGKTYRKSPLGAGSSKNEAGEVIIHSWEDARPLF